MRKLAAFVAQTTPDFLAICEIGSGDARSLATRFALQWAYRGRQAIMWTPAFTPQKVHDRYLPAPHPFDRRGFVRVDGTLGDIPCALMTTQFASDRSTRDAQLRFARTQLRARKTKLRITRGAVACELRRHQRARYVTKRAVNTHETAAIEGMRRGKVTVVHLLRRERRRPHDRLTAAVRPLQRKARRERARIARPDFADCQKVRSGLRDKGGELAHRAGSHQAVCSCVRGNYKMLLPKPEQMRPTASIAV